MFVQNFENNYVEFDRPMIKVNNPAYKTDNSNDSKVNIEISGKILGSTNGIGSIYVYYDKSPTFLSYKQIKMIISKCSYPIIPPPIPQ
ncbi:MAG: hypothetical protein WBZ36_03750 [Candidatus Nitrosopolaris sp.]